MDDVVQPAMVTWVPDKQVVEVGENMKISDVVFHEEITRRNY